jgi:uncharacterized membrane protein YkoI
MRTLLTVTVTGLALLLLRTAAPADEEKIPLNKLPKAVTNAVKERFPKAELLRAEKENENGKLRYEVALKHKGHRLDATFTPDGKLVEIEKVIALKHLPKAVAEAVKAKYAGATLKKAEEITHVKDGKEQLDAYEVQLTTSKGQTVEVEIAPDGRILHVEVGKSKEKK